MKLSEKIAETAKRLGLAKRAVSRLDDRAALLRDQSVLFSLVRKGVIAAELHAIESERAALADIVELAQVQAEQTATEQQQAEQSAIRNLHEISRRAMDAAEQADKALKEAARAISECEAELEPLAFTLLPPGSVRARCRFPALNAVIAKAMPNQIGRAASLDSDNRTFAHSIQMLLGDASANASRIRNAKAA